MRRVGQMRFCFHRTGLLTTGHLLVVVVGYLAYVMLPSITPHTTYSGARAVLVDGVLTALTALSATALLCGLVLVLAIRRRLLRIILWVSTLAASILLLLCLLSAQV